MALTLSITTNKGLTTQYHRILSVTITDKIVVLVKSYCDETYRDIERAIAADVTLLIQISEQMGSIVYSTETHDLIVSLTDQYNEICARGIDRNSNRESYALVEREYQLPLDKELDINFTDLYDQLKLLPEFEGAIDA